MAKIVVKSKVKKVKRKFPVELKAPEVFGSVSLGKSTVTDLKAFIGKSIKMNLMYITNNIKNQNIRVFFNVESVDSGIAKTVLTGYEQIPYYLNRFVKTGSDLLEMSFVCKTKDGINLRIKPFCVTKKNTSSLKLGDMRSKISEIISKDVSEMNAQDFLHSVILGKVQLGYRSEIKKIFPLKSLEFKKVLIEK